jgi:DNA recombination protein RmuC
MGEECLLTSSEKVVIIALLLVNLIGLVILLIKQSKNKNSNKFDELSADLTQKMNNEFERSRRENGANERELRKEISDSLGVMNTKIEQLRLDNSERQLKMEQAIMKNLTDIRDRSEEQSERQNKKMSDAVDKMRESNEKKLEEMRQTVDEKLTATLSTRLDSSFKTVSERLESVYKSLGEMKELSTGVTDNVTALNRVLTNVKARGTWAEVQLGSILDQTLPGMYETNFVCVPGTQDRVEFAVRIPSDEGKITYLPIDSKFPMEDYVRLCAAADEGNAEALTAARKALETRVQNEAKTVAKYINVPLTTPFAILYLATEGLYAEISSSRNGVAEKIRTDYNVMLAGPSTITALLNSLSLGFRAVAINEKANEVRTLLAAAKQQYDKFGGLINKARKKIDEAGKTLDEADHRNKIIQKKLSSVEAIDGDNADNILGINENNDTLKEED